MQFSTRLLFNEQARGSFRAGARGARVLAYGPVHQVGLFALWNPTVITALFLGAISVASAIFLILELNRPYGGVMQISIAPIRNAFTQMSR